MTGLSKPPQRRQGPDFRSLLLLVETVSAIRPELTSKWAEHSLPDANVTVYLFWFITFITYTVCVSNFITSSLGVALICCVYKEVYLQIF